MANLILTKSITCNKYNIKNSYELVQKLKSIKITNNDTMVSLDIISMYDKIPFSEVLKSLERRREDITKVTNIPWNTLVNIIRFCVRDSYYVFWKGKCYQQIEGLTTGGSISGILADFVISDLLNTALEEAGFDPILLVKYVDDLLMFIPIEELENFFTIINSQHHAIQFTLEQEEDGKLPYLDIMIHRNKNHTLDTSLHIKSTSKNRILNWNSSHPKTQRLGVAYGLISRTLNITSDKLKDESLEIIHNILIMNGYPPHIIKNLINKYITKNNTANIDDPETSGNVRTKYRSLTYAPALSEKLQHLFEQHDKDLKVAFKPHFTISKITTKKSLDNEEDRHGVVYKIQCNDCLGVYIGHTGQKISNRMRQHQLDVNNKHDPNRQTGAILHHIETGHTFDYNNAEILISELNSPKRRTLESINIHRHKINSVNLRADLDNLHPSYVSIL